MPKTIHQFAEETVARFHKMARNPTIDKQSVVHHLASVQLQIDLVNMFRSYLQEWDETNDTLLRENPSTDNAVVRQSLLKPLVLPVAERVDTVDTPRVRTRTEPQTEERNPSIQ